MTWGPIARWKRWRASRGGQHRPGAVRSGVDVNLEIQLDQARRKLADVEQLSPVVERRVMRVNIWLRDNHLGPLFDEALGLNPNQRKA